MDTGHRQVNVQFRVNPEATTIRSPRYILDTIPYTFSILTMKSATLCMEVSWWPPT